MSKMSRLEQALAEADDIEAAEHTADPDAPLPDHVKVARPGRARSKVLQVRLNPEEMAQLESLAERRNLPVSTVAREQILRLLATEQQPAEQQPAQANTFVVGLKDNMTRFVEVLAKSLPEQPDWSLASLPSAKDVRFHTWDLASAVLPKTMTAFHADDITHAMETLKLTTCGKVKPKKGASR